MSGILRILNAFILSNHDAQTGTLSADTRLTFANMWALQQQTGDEKGTWSWYHFDNQPWEASDSQYYGDPRGHRSWDSAARLSVEPRHPS
jgi:hypothetical protein